MDARVSRLAGRDRSLLLIVDAQERLLPAIADGEAVIAACATLIDGAMLFDVPIVACEQNPRGLGPTAEVLRTRLTGAAMFEKLTFSAYADPAIRARIEAAPDQAVVLCGLEAHVCVLQTALDLRAAGREVFVCADAIGSRKAESRDLALPRLRQAGVQVVSVEMLLFEWAGAAGTDAFRAMSRLVR